MELKNKARLLERIAKVIIDRRNLLFLLYIIVIIFSMFSMHWVRVENDIIYYLSEDSKTRQGITIMNEEFTTFGMADIMISNISYGHAREVADKIGDVHGVASVMFDNTEDYYNNSSALFVVLFSGEDTDESSLKAMEEIRNIVEPYDFSISTTVGVDIVAQLAKDMTIVGVLATIIIVSVLVFTSQSYAEVPVLLMTFGVAALLNMGTNFMLGKISFISNSVGVILQLALAIDYAIILCHRFTEEHEHLPAREAAILALSKAVPEISSSSLTTIAGLGALAFMQFGIGKDLAAVMIKAIFLSMLSVFTLMPGLLVMFSNSIQRTKHRNFIPSVSAIGRFSIKTRHVIPPVFALVLVVSFVLSSKCPFVFSVNDIRAHRMSDTQLAKDRIEENFGTKNMIALIVPSGDYSAEKKLLTTLRDYDEVESAVGLSNTEAIGGYMLTDSLTPRQFSELVDLDFELAQLLYSAYAVNDEDYGKVISGISYYSVPLIDMYQFLYDEVAQGYIPFDGELMEDLEEYNELLTTARKQMEGDNFTRMLLYLNLPVESKETYDFLSAIYEDTGKYYDNSRVYLVGESSNALDLSSTFTRDNLIISILSVVFVILILTFTFQSAGLPILLISVIQASIWINFSLPVIKGQGIYFLGFLLVSSIQMGANIDYAIVITSRYLALKEKLPPRQAVIEALNQGFPTVITSGSILAVAGILIGRISTDGATSVLGSCLGQGTIISVILVIFVLPQLLYLGDPIIERTSFKLKTPTLFYQAEGKVHFTGRLDGYVKGEVHAYVDGTIAGEIRPVKGSESEANDNHGHEEMQA
ncbi:MAG: efflux RND transporter permease subunit [Bacillota bacterium]